MSLPIPFVLMSTCPETPERNACLSMVGDAFECSFGHCGGPLPLVELSEVPETYSERSIHLLACLNARSRLV